MNEPRIQPLTPEIFAAKMREIIESKDCEMERISTPPMH